MNEHQHPTEDTYQTGRTAPPKSYRGIIAFLLVLVIFLCGVSTALGLMNIHLFRALKQQPKKTDSALSFSQEDAQQTLPQSQPVRFAALGLSGEAVSDFWQQYLTLPDGIYVTEVTEKTAQFGLRPGDILLQVGATPVGSVQALTTLLESCNPGEIAQLLIYRDGQQLSIAIPIQ